MIPYLKANQNQLSFSLNIFSQIFILLKKGLEESFREKKLEETFKRGANEWHLTKISNPRPNEMHLHFQPLRETEEGRGLDIWCISEGETPILSVHHL